MKLEYDKIAKAVGDEPFNAQQKWTELHSLMMFLTGRDIKKVLEIGVYQGGTMMAWTYMAQPNAYLLGVDLPSGPFGGGFDVAQAKKIKSLAKLGQTIELMPADSQNPRIVEVIRRQGPFDFIFIDGDHSYEGAKQDYENYFPMLAEGGVMAFHDIVEHTNTDVQVHKLWQEIKSKHESHEFVDGLFVTDHGNWGGIGVIVK